MNLKNAVNEFLHSRCDGLRQNSKIAKQERETGLLQGTSIKPNQIPYNMQMDIDKLCLENAMARFLDSGSYRDAFDVYFCYMEMFLGEYSATRSMVELLSEYENNGSSLLMKHRDHYAHSVYVFALGLAIYETNSKYRTIYADYYGLTDQTEAAHHYLRYWGLTSLFHDIGYPMELPFEQVAAYFEVNRENRSEKPYIAYHCLGSFAGSCNEIIARRIYDRLGDTYNFSYEYILDVIIRKPRYPDEFNYFMDHAVFSATILYRRLFIDRGLELTDADIDALAAIILHNSMYKFKVADYKNDGNKPFEAELMPLTYMLMLCDELQAWDRTAYGRNSRNEIQPMDCSFEFTDGSLTATYIYDEGMKYKEENLKKKAPGKAAFDEDIASIVRTELVGLKSDLKWLPRNDSRKRTYLSNSNFMSLYNFAVALNGRWMLGDDWKDAVKKGKGHEFLEEHMENFEKAFENMSLEYKLSNINQAKSFDKYLNEIGAFYTDRPVDFPELKEFTEAECLKIGPMEHERWLQEHLDMGWGYGKLKGAEREQKRLHGDMIQESMLIAGKLTSEAAALHYKMLDKKEQDKDVEPMNAMLALLGMFDGARVYRIS